MTRRPDTLEVLQLVADLEGNAEAYLSGTLLPTDYRLGFVNPTQARRLMQKGLLEPSGPDDPLRLTPAGREMLQ